MTVRFGVFPLPQVAPYAALADRARRVEAMGFDALYLSDTTPMTHPGQLELDPWSTLAALARETTTLRLGTAITPPVLRHPLLTAMAVSSLDDVSGGRAILGMGAGGEPTDNAGVGLQGVTTRELVARLDEQLDTIDRLLRGETVSRLDGFYPTSNAFVPRPVQVPRPPVLVAAQAQRSIEVAAGRADIWNTLGGQPTQGDRIPRDQAIGVVREQLSLLDDACERVGRDPATIERSVFAYRAGLYDSFDSFEDWIGRFVDLGFDELIISWPDGERQNAIVERFAAGGMTRLRSGSR